MATEVVGDIEQSPLHSKKRRPLVRFVTILIGGAAVYLATNSAVAGAVLPSAYGGWRSVTTGLWIYKTDPHRSRAKICSAFFLATALWQAAAAACGSVVVFIVLASLTGKNPDMDSFAATMVTLTTGVVLSTLVGLLASVAASVQGIRVWIHPMLRQIVRDDLQGVTEWPPQARFNYAIFVLATSVAFPVLAVCCLMLVDPVSEALALVLFLGGVCLAVVAYIRLSSRIIATHPIECWARGEIP
jgi:hypothetical protein